MVKEIIPVILLVYKDTELVAPLLSTIQEEYVDVRIILLDNGSTETTWGALNEIDDPRVTFIRTNENLGYTGGINYAAAYAKNNIQDFKNIFIINPDTKCTPNLIFSLAEILNKDGKAACISPKILSFDKTVTYSGGKINKKNGTVEHIIFTDEFYPHNSYEVDSYTGCAVLFDINKFIEAGMLNEAIFMYYDEADLSMKLREKELKVLYAPFLEVFHDVSYTMGAFSPLKTYYMSRNKFLVFNSSMGLLSKIYFVMYELAYHIKNRRIKNAWFHLKGVSHYFKGKTGYYSNEPK